MFLIQRKHNSIIWIWYSLGTNCIAKTLTCELEESRLVWNETVFHTCPYYEIDHTGIFFTKNNFLINKEESLLLEPTGESIKCKDTVLYKTEQGLLFWDIFASLKANSQFLKEIKNYKREKSANNIMLSAIDFNRYEELTYQRQTDSALPGFGY